MSATRNGKKVVKQCIPRDFRCENLPCWDLERNKLNKNFKSTVKRRLQINRYVQSAIKYVKFNKTAGLDEMVQEFLKYSGPKTIKWLLDFFSKILQFGTFPKYFIHPKALAVFKPDKPENNISWYRSISLLIVY